jgi:hypothetical protein
LAGPQVEAGFIPHVKGSRIALSTEEK